MSERTPRRTAVVIGASMAGLSAAAVLASRFDRVVILDRDELPAGPAERRGCPRAATPTACCRPGSSGWRAGSPGLTTSWWPAAPGRRPRRLLVPGDRARRRFTSGVKGPVASRALLEHRG